MMIPQILPIAVDVNRDENRWFAGIPLDLTKERQV